MKPTELIEKMEKLQKFIHKDIPRIVKREALNHFEESWTNQGFTDKNLIKWDKRKAPPQLTKKLKQQSKTYSKWKKDNEGRAILVSKRTNTDGGHLKDSITATITGSAVIFATDKPYALIHNQGGFAGRNNKAFIPKRQFMGHSQTLMDNIEKKIETLINKIML